MYRLNLMVMLLLVFLFTSLGIVAFASVNAVHAGDDGCKTCSNGQCPMDPDSDGA